MSISLEKLNNLVQRIESIEEEKAKLNEDSREIYAEAKGEGFDVKILREVIKIRKMRPEEVSEKEELLHLYLNALNV
jgi:uncharacterized protein (UPF0335 family)